MDRRLYILLNTTVPLALDIFHRRLIGQYFSTSDLSPSLKVGLTSHFFNSCWHLPLFIQVFENKHVRLWQTWKFFQDCVADVIRPSGFCYVYGDEDRFDIFLRDSRSFQLSSINFQVLTELVTFCEYTRKNWLKISHFFYRQQLFPFCIALYSELFAAFECFLGNSDGRKTVGSWIFFLKYYFVWTIDLRL